MARWAKIFLWLSSCWLLVFSGGSKAMAQLSSLACSQVQVSTIKNGQYRATIDFYKKHLSGILIVKQTADTTLRLVFTNEVGFKFFDFEFSPAAFKVNYILAGMNKKAVVQILESDLGMVCYPGRLQSIIIEDATGGPQFIAPGKPFYYYADSDCTSIVRIEKIRKRKISVIASLSGTVESQPKDIVIQHRGIRLRLQLSRLSN